MVDIDADEVAELFPFAARKAIECEVSVNHGQFEQISVAEILAVVKSNPPMASIHEHKHEDAGYPLWAFYTAIDHVISNYTMSTYVGVDEARSLRDAERSV